MNELSREQIVEYASQYVAAEDVGDFPMDGDLFCVLTRELAGDRATPDHEAWEFREYGVCAGYRLDKEAKPKGKWLWFEYVSLATFPPHPSVLKLQPPHVVKGRFQDPGRTREHRILRVPLDRDSLHDMLAAALHNAEPTSPPAPGQTAEQPSSPRAGEHLPDNVIRFPGPSQRRKR